MAAKDPLRILCFGDSLTEGYSQYGLVFTPYSTTMKKILEEKLGNGWEIEVDTDGQSGEQVTAGFMHRMMAIYKSDKTVKCPYDWVIFLGGTNDLGWGKPNEVIYDAILKITNIPLEHNAQLLIMTVPEASANIQSLNKRRDELNDMIANDGREGVFVLDLKEKMPYHSLEEVKRRELWDDGLHFTPEGYEKMGTLVAERLVGIMSGRGYTTRKEA